MPGSSSAKTRFALLPGHDECRHLDSKHTFATSRREASEALHEISRPIEGVGNAGCPLHPQPRVRFVLVESTQVSQLSTRHHNALRSSGTSPNFLITLASLKTPVAGSPVRLNATAPTWPCLCES